MEPSGRHTHCVFSSFSSSRTVSVSASSRKSSKVLGVQTDRERLARVVRVERLGSLAELLARGGDRQEILVERELDPARAFGGEERDTSDRSLESGSRHAGDPVVLLGEDLFVVGEVHIEEPGDQLPVPDREEQMILGVADLELSVLAVHLQDLGQRLLGDEHVRKAPLRLAAREIQQGQPVAVGRDELELLALLLEQRAHQLEPGLSAETAYKTFRVRRFQTSSGNVA
jgi:hypothetical protein